MMKRLFLLISLFVAPSVAQATTQSVQGFCSVGGVQVATQGMKSTTTVVASYPKCLVTVYNTGTTTLATIYADAAGTALANPFTANTNASYLFYATTGAGLDVTLSGGTPLAFPEPYTLSDIVPGGTGGGGGGGGVFPGTVNYIGVYADPSNIGPSATTVNSIAPVLQGKLNTDLFGGINAVLTSSVCITIDCYIERSVTSSDTTMSQPLAVTTNTNSSLLVDDQNNSIATMATNPQPSNNLPNIGSNNTPGLVTAQALYPDYMVYSQPNPGTVQGATQEWRNHNSLYAGAGYSLGNEGCPNNCAQSKYTGGASEWSVSVDDNRTINFNTAGIHQSGNLTANCFGIGDCSLGWGYLYEQYAGGCITASDECFYGAGASHFYTPGDFYGPLATITDTTHIKVTPSGNVGTQGDGRYVMDTSTPIYSAISASLITAPSTVPGTIVFPGANFPLPDAVGTLATACIVPIQDSGMASTSCVVNVTSGTLVVSGDPVCLVTNNSNNGLDFGGQITAVTALSGGQQTMTVKIRKTLDPAAFTVYVYQSKMCGTVIDLTADITANSPNGSPLHGGVFPIVVATDAHTLAYYYEQASQSWATIPAQGSFFRTTAISGGGTPAGGSFNLNTLTRTANVVTATLSVTNSFNPATINLQRYFTISGCTDTTMNVVGNPNPIVGTFNLSSTSTLTYTQPGSNANSTCANAVLTLNDSLVNINYAAEVFDVADPAPGIPAANVVDGYMSTSYQPNFVTGHTMDMPTHYSSSRTGMVLDMEGGQPYTASSKGLVVSLGRYDSFGEAAYTAINPEQNYTAGLGGLGQPADVLDTVGGFSDGINMDTAPWPTGSINAVLKIGFPYSGLPAGLQNYDIFNLNSNDVKEHFDSPSLTLSDFFAGAGVTFTRSPTATTASLVPMIIQNAQFEGPILGTNNFTPQTQLKSCAVQDSFIGVCYQDINNTPPTITSVTTGSQERFYWIASNQSNGTVSWSPPGYTFTSAVTPDNEISCSIVPSGMTGTVYTIPPGANTFQTVGATANQCTSSSVTVTDTGTYGSALGQDVRNLSGTFYAGRSVVDGNSSFAFTVQNTFNGPDGSINTLGIAQQVSMPTAGTWSFDTTTKGNAAATINAATVNAAAVNIGGSPACTVATGCGGSLAPVISGYCTGAEATAGTFQMFNLGSTNASCTASGTVGFVMPYAASLSKLTVRCHTTGVSSLSGVYTVLDTAQGSTTATVTPITVTYGTSTSGTAVIDTTHSYAASFGDLIQIQFTTQASETMANCSASLSL